MENKSWARKNIFAKKARVENDRVSWNALQTTENMESVREMIWMLVTFWKILTEIIFWSENCFVNFYRVIVDHEVGEKICASRRVLNRRRRREDGSDSKTIN